MEAKNKTIKAFALRFFKNKDGNAVTKTTGMGALYRKELSDHFKSKRFLIILLLIIATSIASIYTAVTRLPDVVNSGGSEFVFLKLFTTGGDASASGVAMPSFVSFISFLGPLIGFALGFDSINGERARGTLNRLVSQPIYRDAVVNGKFMAGVTVIIVMVFSLILIIGGVGLVIIGVPPTFEELMRLLIFMIFTVVFISLWLGLSILFSILFRHTATSALSVIAIWLFFAVFMGLIAGIISNGLYPVSDNSPPEMRVQNSEVAQTLNRISPSVLYGEAVGAILSPQSRTLSNVILTERVEGAVSGSLPLDQSVMLVWPHLTGLLALSMIIFALSYISFMRQEIRTT